MPFSLSLYVNEIFKVLLNLVKRLFNAISARLEKKINERVTEWMLMEKKSHCAENLDSFKNRNKAMINNYNDYQVPLLK